MINAQNLNEQLKAETLKYRRKISKSRLGNLGFILSALSPPSWVVLLIFCFFIYKMGL